MAYCKDKVCTGTEVSSIISSQRPRASLSDNSLLVWAQF